MKMMRDIISNIIRNYIPNYIINKIPFYCLRHLYYRKVMNIHISKNASIHLGCFIEKGRSQKGEIGENSVINRKCYLDFRGGLKIAENVSISSYTKIITASHLMNSSDFKYISKEVKIERYVWIGTGAIILPGITLGEGSVIGAGAVVTKDVKPYTFVAGNPAVEKSKRSKNLKYNPKYLRYFD